MNGEPHNKPAGRPERMERLPNMHVPRLLHKYHKWARPGIPRERMEQPTTNPGGPDPKKAGLQATKEWKIP